MCADKKCPIITTVRITKMGIGSFFEVDFAVTSKGVSELRRHFLPILNPPPLSQMQVAMYQYQWNEDMKIARNHPCEFPLRLTEWYLSKLGPYII